jgi:hypothetical protein
MRASKLCTCFELFIKNVLFLHLLCNNEARSRNHCCHGKAVLHKTYKIHIRALRNIHTYVINQQMHTHAMCSISVHLLVYCINVKY